MWQEPKRKCMVSSQWTPPPCNGGRIRIYEDLNSHYALGFRVGAVGFVLKGLVRFRVHGVSSK